jgi:hypothetical protein
VSNPFSAGRDSQGGHGDNIADHQGMMHESMMHTAGHHLNEEDYRSPDMKGGMGRPDVTAPPSGQMQPEDKARAAGGNPTPSAGMPPPGHGK